MSTDVPGAASEEVREHLRGAAGPTKALNSLADEPVVYYWSGLLYRTVGLREATASYPATGGFTTSNLLFRVEGFNIRRAYRDSALPLPSGGTGPGTVTLSREMMFYLDPKTGSVLEEWDNRYVPVNPDGTGGVVTKTVQVLHVANDPVNFAAPDNPASGNFIDHLVPLGDDKLVMPSDIFLNYPSALAGDPKYARFSAHDRYQAAEMFRWIIDKKTLFDPALNSADVTVSWARTSQYLPWMHMGQAPGGTVVQAVGCKVRGAFEGLPEWMKREVRSKYPKYTEPPSGKLPVPNVNETSWTYFKKELDTGRYIPTPVP